MTDVNTEVPESFDYNETDLETGRGAPSRLRVTSKDEIFRGKITKVARSVAKKSGNLQLELKVRALAGDQEKGPPVTQWVTIPVPNPNIPGHRPYDDTDEGREQKKKDFSRARSLIRAVKGEDGGLPPFARWDKEKKKSFDPESGEELTPKQAAEFEKKVNDATVRQLQTWFKTAGEGCEILNAQVYFGTREGNNGYTNLQYMQHDDGGKSVITEGFTVSVDGEGSQGS
jgi:hypothetical protein